MTGSIAAILKSIITRWKFPSLPVSGPYQYAPQIDELMSRIFKKRKKKKRAFLYGKAPGTADRQGTAEASFQFHRGWARSRSQLAAAGFLPQDTRR